MPGAIDKTLIGWGWLGLICPHSRCDWRLTRMGNIPTLGRLLFIMRLELPEEECETTNHRIQYNIILYSSMWPTVREALAETY
jgi:hypothetical protein